MWDDQSAYCASWSTNNFRPTGIARHPLDPSRFFVLSRSTKSAVYLLEFDGSSVSPVPGWPQIVDISSTSPDNYSESGLSAASKDSILYLAATDAYRKQITEYVVSGSNIISTTTYSTALQAAGSTQLSLPTDCAYVPGTNRPVLFALDNHERVVRITDDIPEPALVSSLLLSLALRLHYCKSAGSEQ